VDAQDINPALWVIKYELPRKKPCEPSLNLISSEIRFDLERILRRETHVLVILSRIKILEDCLALRSWKAADNSLRKIRSLLTRSVYGTKLLDSSRIDGSAKLSLNSQSFRVHLKTCWHPLDENLDLASVTLGVDESFPAIK